MHQMHDGVRAGKENGTKSRRDALEAFCHLRAPQKKIQQSGCPHFPLLW